jgi:hypothetical protein
MTRRDAGRRVIAPEYRRDAVRALPRLRARDAAPSAPTRGAQP